MSTQIIAKTHPAPGCDLSPNEVEQFVDGLAGYHDQFVPAFRRPGQARWSEVYLRGLLGDSPRKTIERIGPDIQDQARDRRGPVAGGNPARRVAIQRGNLHRRRGVWLDG